MHTHVLVCLSWLWAVDSDWLIWWLIWWPFTLSSYSRVDVVTATRLAFSPEGFYRQTHYIGNHTIIYIMSPVSMVMRPRTQPQDVPQHLCTHTWPLHDLSVTPTGTLEVLQACLWLPGDQDVGEHRGRSFDLIALWLWLWVVWNCSGRGAWLGCGGVVRVVMGGLHDCVLVLLEGRRLNLTFLLWTWMLSPGDHEITC